MKLYNRMSIVVALFLIFTNSFAVGENKEPKRLIPHLSLKPMFREQHITFLRTGINRDEVIIERGDETILLNVQTNKEKKIDLKMHNEWEPASIVGGRFLYIYESDSFIFYRYDLLAGELKGPKKLPLPEGLDNRRGTFNGTTATFSWLLRKGDKIPKINDDTLSRLSKGDINCVLLVITADIDSAKINDVSTHYSPLMENPEWKYIGFQEASNVFVLFNKRTAQLRYVCIDKDKSDLVDCSAMLAAEQENDMINIITFPDCTMIEAGGAFLLIDSMYRVHGPLSSNAEHKSFNITQLSSGIFILMGSHKYPNRSYSIDFVNSRIETMAISGSILSDFISSEGSLFYRTKWGDLIRVTSDKPSAPEVIRESYLFPLMKGNIVTGNSLFVPCAGGTKLKVFNAETGKLRMVMQFNGNPIVEIALASDDNYSIALLFDSGAIKIINTLTMKGMHDVTFFDQKILGSDLDLIYSRSRVIVGIQNDGNDGIIMEYSFENGTITVVSNVALYAANGRYFIMYNEDNKEKKFYACDEMPENAYNESSIGCREYGYDGGYDWKIEVIEEGRIRIKRKYLFGDAEDEYYFECPERTDTSGVTIRPPKYSWPYLLIVLNRYEEGNPALLFNLEKGEVESLRLSNPDSVTEYVYPMSGGKFFVSWPRAGRYVILPK